MPTGAQTVPTIWGTLRNLQTNEKTMRIQCACKHFRCGSHQLVALFLDYIMVHETFFLLNPDTVKILITTLPVLYVNFFFLPIPQYLKDFD